MESINVDTVMGYFERSSLIVPKQHGFRQHWLSMAGCPWQLDREAGNDTGIDVTYLDFSKAFDLIHHGILPHKFHAYGVRNPVLRWVGTSLYSGGFRFESALIF